MNQWGFHGMSCQGFCCRKNPWLEDSTWSNHRITRSWEESFIHRNLSIILPYPHSWHILTPLFLQNNAWWKGLRWWYDDKVTRQLKIKCSSQHGGLIIFLSNGSYSHAKSSECPIPPFWVFERPPKIHILNAKNGVLGVEMVFLFKAVIFSFPCSFSD